MSSHFFGVTTRRYEYSHTIDRNSQDGIGFRHPVDVAVGEGGKIYVVNHGIEFIPKSTRVGICTTIDEEYLGEMGHYGRGKGEFVWPCSVALDSSSNVYVSDNYLNRITVFNNQGEYLDDWGSEGNGNGELGKPAGVVTDSEDNLYVVDSANHRVQVFTKEGKFLAKWGSEGEGEGEFNLPWGITIDDKGDVWVADWRNNRIQKFTADGTFLASFGTLGNQIGQFKRPSDVAVDKDGDFYVTDWGNNRVQAFTPEGRYITAFTGDAGISKWGKEYLESSPDMMLQRATVRDFETERRFSNPVALGVDEEKRIIVVDSNWHRLQVYQKTS